jgi:hypothetical protein
MSRVRPLILATLCAAALGTTVVSAIAEDSKYPDLKGQWVRTFVPIWSPRNKRPPLTPEYMKVFEQNLAIMADGDPGNVASTYCAPQGMPMMMNAYDPMELIVTPEVTYILISHVDDSFRRIYTDGRDWPEDVTPIYTGYSIGRWIDEDYDGKDTAGLCASHDCNTQYFSLTLLGLPSSVPALAHDLPPTVVCRRVRTSPSRQQWHEKK